MRTWVLFRAGRFRLTCSTLDILFVAGVLALGFYFYSFLGNRMGVRGEANARKELIAFWSTIDVGLSKPDVLQAFHNAGYAQIRIREYAHDKNKHFPEAADVLYVYIAIPSDLMEELHIYLEFGKDEKLISLKYGRGSLNPTMLEGLPPDELPGSI